VLHSWKHKAIEKMANSRTLLIDAGANEHGRMPVIITGTFDVMMTTLVNLVNDLDTIGTNASVRSAVAGVVFSSRPTLKTP